ncbi:hypothetical protein [Kaistella palustris]|uniref:hypothetical protein n=1 Tax=Kaistella palustris TaxID=493376 RepID=UPI000419D38E|nr:hypothetical protein [Kaistella palustris]
MTKSIRITVIIIGALTIGAALYACLQGTHDAMTYFALLMGAALIITSVLTGSSTDAEE